MIPFDAGTQVGVVITIDGDTLPEYTDIIYTILTGNGLGNFTINSTTGIITTATILDREKTSEYVLTIGAENPVGGTTGTATVSIFRVIISRRCYLVFHVKVKNVELCFNLCYNV